MPKYVFVVLTNPTQGMEAEYNRWYDEVHLPDVCAIPGVRSARRFRLSTSGGSHQYLALYEIEADDYRSVLNEIRARAGTDKMVMSEALDRSTISATMFEQISEWPR